MKRPTATMFGIFLLLGCSPTARHPRRQISDGQVNQNYQRCMETLHPYRDKTSMPIEMLAVAYGIKPQAQHAGMTIRSSTPGKEHDPDWIAKLCVRIRDEAVRGESQPSQDSPPIQSTGFSGPSKFIASAVASGKKIAVLVVVGYTSASSDGAAPDKSWNAAIERDVASKIEFLLLHHFGSNPNFRLIDRSQMGELLSEIKLSSLGVVAEKERLEIGRFSGATHLLSVMATAKDGANLMSMRLIEIESGEIKAVGIPADVSGNPSQ